MAIMGQKKSKNLHRPHESQSSLSARAKAALAAQKQRPGSPGRCKWVRKVNFVMRDKCDVLRAARVREHFEKTFRALQRFFKKSCPG